MAICPFAEWKPVPSHSGSMTAHYGLVLHVQQGDNSLYDFFNNKANQVSSTFWISKDGRIEQYVDSDVIAWAQAAGNPTYNSVETEGFDKDPLSDAQVEALAHLMAWGNGRHGWPIQLAEKPGQTGLGYHAMGGEQWGGHPCPGTTRIGQRQDVLNRATQLLNQPEGNVSDFVNPMVDFLITKSGNGYWAVADDGGIFSFGDAQFYGSHGGQPLNAPVVGGCVTPSGAGYWLVAADGGVFAYGDAQFFGSEGGKPLAYPIRGIRCTPNGDGYWLFAEDGGVFCFGTAQFLKSTDGKAPHDLIK